MKRRLRRLLTRFRELNGTKLNFHDRLLRASRPWAAKDFLHQLYDGQFRQLHGHQLPAAHRGQE